MNYLLDTIRKLSSALGYQIVGQGTGTEHGPQYYVYLGDNSIYDGTKEEVHDWLQDVHRERFGTTL